RRVPPLSCRARGPRPFGSTRATRLPRGPRRSLRPGSGSAPRRKRGTPPPSGPSLPQPRLQDLLAMEPSELEVLGRSLGERVERDEPDDLALGDLDPFFRRERPDRFDCLDQGGLAVVPRIHRYF